MNMNNYKTQKEQYTHNKSSFFKTILVKLFGWILGKRFIIQQTEPKDKYEWLYFKEQQSWYDLPNSYKIENYLKTHKYE